MSFIQVFARHIAPFRADLHTCRFNNNTILSPVSFGIIRSIKLRAGNIHVVTSVCCQAKQRVCGSFNTPAAWELRASLIGAEGLVAICRLSPHRLSPPTDPQAAWIEKEFSCAPRYRTDQRDWGRKVVGQRGSFGSPASPPPTFITTVATTVTLRHLSFGRMDVSIEQKRSYIGRLFLPHYGGFLILFWRILFMLQRSSLKGKRISRTFLQKEWIIKLVN